MLARTIRYVASFAACLLLIGFAADVATRSASIQVDEHAAATTETGVLVGLALLGLVVLLASGRAAFRLFKKGRKYLAVLSALTCIIVFSNLAFWGLVAARFTPVQRLFEKGHVVWVGRKAFLFGHGYWDVSDGYWEHQTLVQLTDQEVYQGSTLELLAQLRARGASSVWGSWCYTGNFPYIRKDLVSGRHVPWPRYASYNTTPGMTIPIWFGSTFVRIGLQQNQYIQEPDQIRPTAPDTLYLLNPTTHRIEQAFSLMRQRIPGLPRPDSVSWYPIDPDTVLAISRDELMTLPYAERARIREQEMAKVEEKTQVVLASYWIRGRAFPVFVRVPAQLRRADS